MGIVAMLVVCIFEQLITGRSGFKIFLEIFVYTVDPHLYGPLGTSTSPYM